MMARRSRNSRTRSSSSRAGQFYLDETRAHLRWGVRIIPVRRIAGGQIDLRGLLEAVDNTGLTEIGKAIADRNSEGFTGAYRRTLEGYFDPAATWP